MIKNSRWVVLLLATLMLLLLPVSSVLAVSSASDFTTWPAQTTTEVDKVWTISFKSPCLSSSINSNTIYVKNSKQAKIATTVKLSADGLSVTVTPKSAYPAGEYNLYITNEVMSLNGEKLGEQILFPFSVTVPSPATPIIGVQRTFNAYVTDFTVKTAPDVYSVKVNTSTTMQYTGNNSYNAGVFGLTEGSTITFKAYDYKGALLQTYKYQL